MDCTISKGSAKLRELLHRASTEQPIDADFTLPDYCPDIGKLLKCTAIPKVTQRELRGNTVNVEGVCTVRIIYVEAHEKGVRCCERELPFSVSLPVSGSDEAAAILAHAKTSYVNCRATSQRRLDIHGAFTVTVCIYGSSTGEYITQIEGAGIRSKTRELPVSSLVGQCRACFNVSELMELAQGKPPIASIIRSETAVSVSEAKAIANKLIIKGEARLEIVYCTDSGTGLEAMEYRIPFNQFVDINGLDDNCITDIRAEAVNSDISLKTDSDGEYRRINADIRICADIFAWQKTSVKAVCDAYSVECSLAIEKKQLSFENYAFSDSGRAGCTATVNHDKEITEVLDCWCDVGELSSGYAASSVKLRGKAMMCAIVRNTEGDCDYIEKLCDIEREFPFSDLLSPTIEARAHVFACGFTISGSSNLELRAEAELSVSVYDSLSVPCVISIEPGEPIEKKPEDSPALVMYFAGASEELWDIARSCGSSVELIKEENDVSGEALENDTLLLVTVR